MSNLIFNFTNSTRPHKTLINPYLKTHNKQIKRSRIKQHDKNASISKPRAWGILTWMLFHTLAEKIKPERFQQCSPIIISYIKKICSCLPCPVCREDAQQYVSSFDFKLIKSKEDLKLFIFDFHNHVNKKIKNETPHDQILDKYKLLDITNVMNLWYEHFTLYGIEAQEFMEGMQRNNVRNEIRRYIINNRFVFD